MWKANKHKKGGCCALHKRGPQTDLSVLVDMEDILH